MRKTMALALAGALILALGTAGVAQAVNSHQSVAVKLAHSKAGTAAKPKSVGALTVDMKVALDPVRPGVRHALGRDPLRQEPRLQLARSSPAAPRRRSPAAPPRARKAKIGSGKAAGLALGQRRTWPSPPTTAPAARRCLLHVTGSQPLNIDSVIVGQARSPTAAPSAASSSSPSRPTSSSRSAGVYATLTSFVTTVGGSAKGTPYVALKGCSGGKLQVQGRLRLHRRLQAVADLDHRLHEVGRRSRRLPSRAGGAGA